MSEQDESTSKIYDSREYAAAFAEDLSNATRSILIVSPTSRNRMTDFCLFWRMYHPVFVLPFIRKPWKATNPVRSLNCVGNRYVEHAEITVTMQADLQQHYAVIDGTVWHGNIDFLAFGRRTRMCCGLKAPRSPGSF